MARTFSSVGLADKHLKSHLPNGDPRRNFFCLLLIKKNSLQQFFDSFHDDIWSHSSLIMAGGAAASAILSLGELII